MKLEQILTDISGAAKTAQESLERQNLENFLSNFSGDDELIPAAKKILISNSEGKRFCVNVPIAAIIPHNQFKLSQINIKLKLFLNEVNGSINAEFAPSEAEGSGVSEIELVLNTDIPSEGISRIKDKMNINI